VDSLNCNDETVHQKLLFFFPKHCQTRLQQCSSQIFFQGSHPSSPLSGWEGQAGGGGSGIEGKRGDRGKGGGKGWGGRGGGEAEGKTRV